MIRPGATRSSAAPGGAGTAGGHRLLLLTALPPPLAHALSETVDTCSLAEQADRDAYLREHGSEFTLAVTHAGAGADATTLARLPNLQALCSLGVGVDAIDLVAASQRGILVSNTPDVLNDCVADHAIGLLIDVGRSISANDRYVRRGDWAAKGPPPLTARISGKRLGLLGMGRIGKAIAQRANGFAMEIRYHSRSPKPDLAWCHEPSLVQLADWADFLIVACSGGAGTRHLVSAAVLQALGPDGFLVNVARGSVVDQQALVDALRSLRLRGAALDVFEDEPQVPAVLRELDNVVLQPHVGSATRETRRAMADLVLENVHNFIRDRTLVTPCMA